MKDQLYRATIRLERFAATCCAKADRHWFLLLSLFTIAFFWAAGTRASAKPLWHDEIYTVLIANLRSIGTIWEAHRAGIDSMPPLNAMLTHFVLVAFGVNHISARLVPMLGVWTLTVVVFLIVRRRSNTLTALSAMVIALLSNAFGASYEARGYGLMLGFVALSLYCWSEAAAGRHRPLLLPLLTVALGAGIWTHYYAALVVVPISLGEIARARVRGRIDVGMVLSLAGAGIASLPLYPLLRTTVSHAETYFQRTSLWDLRAAYSAVAGQAFVIAFIALVAVIAIVVLLPRISDEHRSPTTSAIPSYEVVAGLATLLMPVWGILVASLVSNAFVPRYAISTVVGMCLTLPMVATFFRRRLASLLLCACLTGFLVYELRDLRPNGTIFRHPTSYRALFLSKLSEAGPIVITGTLYLQLWQYVPPETRKNLFYVADPDASRRLIDTDSLDRDYLVLGRWAPVQVPRYREFLRQHGSFYLYDVSALSWLAEQLRHDGAVLRRLGEESGATMYHVLLPDAAGSGP